MLTGDVFVVTGFVIFCLGETSLHLGAGLAFMRDPVHGELTSWLPHSAAAGVGEVAFAPHGQSS